MGELSASRRGPTRRLMIVAVGLVVALLGSVGTSMATSWEATSWDGFWSEPTLKVSTSPSRDNARNLEGAVVKGNAYVFVADLRSAQKVHFYLDDPDRSGQPFSVERGYPFDFAGSLSSTAKPWNTGTVPDGEHTITSVVVKDSGQKVYSGRFQVSNGSAPAPTASPTTATPTSSLIPTTSSAPTSTPTPTTQPASPAPPAGGARPGPDNTGVKSGVTLTKLSLGDRDRVSYSNTTFENKEVSSNTNRIRFQAPKNLVIRNVKVNGVINIDGGSDVLIEDVEAHMISINHAARVTVRRADVSPRSLQTGGDCFHVGQPKVAIETPDVVIDSSWCHNENVPLFAGQHLDGIQTWGSERLKISKNFFDLRYYDKDKTGVPDAGSNACIFLEGAKLGDPYNEDNALVEDNWIMGCGFMFHVNGKNIKIRNNKLGPRCTAAQLSLPRTGIPCTRYSYLRKDNNPNVTDTSGNVSMATGAPIDIAAG